MKVRNVEGVATHNGPESCVGAGNRAGEAWVVHHMDTGVKWEGVLFDYKIKAHFRYPDSPASPMTNDP